MGIAATLFAVMTPTGRAAAIGYLMGEDLPLSWAYTRNFSSVKSSLKDIADFFSEHPSAAVVRRIGAEKYYLTCSSQDNDFECGFEIPSRVQGALAKVDVAVAARNDYGGIGLFLGDEIRADTHYLIGYIPLGPQANRIENCTNSVARQQRGMCNISLNSNWALHYEWFPEPPSQ